MYTTVALLLIGIICWIHYKNSFGAPVIFDEVRDTRTTTDYFWTIWSRTCQDQKNSKFSARTFKFSPKKTNDNLDKFKPIGSRRNTWWVRRSLNKVTLFHIKTQYVIPREWLKVWFLIFICQDYCLKSGAVSHCWVRKVWKFVRLMQFVKYYLVF